MRLFVALELPQDLRDRLCDIASGLPGADWTPPENYHLTLRFLGEMSRFEAEEVDLALAGLRAPGFKLVVQGVGTTERAGRASLWAGVERNPALLHLQAKIETALQRAGLPPERRRYVPHVTLGRMERAADPRLAAWVQARNLFRAQPVAITGFALFSSILGPDHADYAIEVEYGLAGVRVGVEPG